MSMPRLIQVYSEVISLVCLALAHYLKNKPYFSDYKIESFYVVISLHICLSYKKRILHECFCTVSNFSYAPLIKLLGNVLFLF